MPVAQLFKPLTDKYLPRQVPKGPRMRLGVLWFVGLCSAMVLGSFAVSLLFACVCAVAALQVSGLWRTRKVRANRLVAGVCAGFLPLAAWAGTRAIGVVLLVCVIAAVLLGSDSSIQPGVLGRERIMGNLPVVSATLRSGMFVGLAGAAVVHVEGLDSLSIVYLAALVSVYDSGCYLVGAGQRNRLVGVGAGLAGAMVVIITMTAVYPNDLWSDSTVRWVGFFTAIACPAGQMLGTWILPSARAKAPALRRLDSWLLAAPVFLIGALLGT